MISDAACASILAPTITRYLELKRALGCSYAVEAAVIVSLDAFLASSTAPDLSEASFTAWCRTFDHVASGVRRNRMRIARNLCLYRRRNEPRCFVPDPLLFPPQHRAVQPYIFSEGDVARLLVATRELLPTPIAPLLPQVFRLAIVLLYTMGLRRGELLRMTVGDHDAREQTLLVRESKFHKSRMLPMSADVARELEEYLEARRVHRLQVERDTPLIGNRRQGGRPYTGTGFTSVVRQLLDAAGVRKPDGRRPRIHDFRHSFAVNALLRWYRAGEALDAKLPLLATYMGHVSVVSTQHYLHFVEPVAAAASERFARRYAQLASPTPAAAGGRP